ncbi:hypothetical protein GCM10011506_48090 [Marivirga lumbricoides]|uniref:Uncharacterized protein n=2 Tax=Marivirga lumbricoides TaxID=1046115 RepID=A0ABQ1N821_9BACT|nr:hypothetical protein GCM10011506_48090 [Marivirga lumbricoides]
MFVRIHRGETTQTFNIWVYGEKKADLVRGSGLYIDATGKSLNHHFLLPKDGSNYQFLEGKYKLEVFASTLGAKKPQRIFTVELSITHEQAEKLKLNRLGLYFDWGAESNAYHPNIYEPPLKGEEIERLLS